MSYYHKFKEKDFEKCLHFYKVNTDCFDALYFAVFEKITIIFNCSKCTYYYSLEDIIHRRFIELIRLPEFLSIFRTINFVFDYPSLLKFPVLSELELLDIQLSKDVRISKVKISFTVTSPKYKKPKQVTICM